jgi:hypothetical protein
MAIEIKLSYLYAMSNTISDHPEAKKVYNRRSIEPIIVSKLAI